MSKKEDYLESLAETMVRQMLNPSNDPVLNAIIDDAVRDSKKAAVEEEQSEAVDHVTLGNVIDMTKYMGRREESELVTARDILAPKDEIGGEIIEVALEGFKLRGTPESVMQMMKMLEANGQKG